jgi:hypothetical protein
MVHRLSLGRTLTFHLLMQNLVSVLRPKRRKANVTNVKGFTVFDPHKSTAKVRLTIQELKRQKNG